MYKEAQVNQKVVNVSPKRILIGEIATAHGIKGLVKVRSYVDDETLLESKPLYTEETGNKTIVLTLKNALKNDWLMEADGVTDRNAAEDLRGTQLYIDRDQLPDAGDGEFYVEDMKGMKVVDAKGNDIGTILSVENFGASDLLDIRPAAGGDSFYVPFTDETIIDVNVDDGVVTVEIPETLA